MTTQRFCMHPVLRTAALAFAACAALACTHTAPTGGDIGRLVQGNTLEVVNRFGPSFIYFHEDGRFTHVGIQNQVTVGVWRATRDSVCATTTILPSGKSAPEHCLLLGGRSMGESWQGKTDPRKGPLGYRLLAGHPDIHQVHPQLPRRGPSPTDT